MAGKLSEADAKQWHMREAAHCNGGAVFFAYLHSCVEQPRLARYDRYDRKTRGVTSTWRVDGEDKASLADAIEALNTPPTFAADELAFIAAVPDEYLHRSELREKIDFPWEVADGARNKGAVEWEKGCCRRTALGRTALAEDASRTNGGGDG